jgi:hypothetical protein
MSFHFADGYMIARQRLPELCGLVLALAFSLVLLSQVVEGQERLSQKIAPASNFKVLTAFLRETDLCHDGCRLIGSWFMARGPIYMTDLDLRHERSS